MARISPRGMPGSGALALGIGCLMITLASCRTKFTARPPNAAPGPIVRERRTASNLILTQVTPEYPALAKSNYIQGHVRLQVAVTREGRVGEAHVVQGHPFLAASALKAVRGWRYRPFKAGSALAAFVTVVDVNFVLHSKKLSRLPFQAEQDLSRQIRPPEILGKPLGQPPTASVRLRVLVSDSGRAMDSTPVAGFPVHFAAARKNVELWTFRPARWGALPVPWYLEVDVPVEDWPSSRAAGDPGGQ